MATPLSKEQAEKVLQLHVRAQNKLKGSAFDLMSQALPNDRQVDMFKKLVKEQEQGQRRGFAEALVEAGLIEGFDPTELARMR